MVYTTSRTRHRLLAGFATAALFAGLVVWRADGDESNAGLSKTAAGTDVIVHGAFASLTLAEFVARTSHIGAVTVLGVRNQAFADNPDIDRNYLSDPMVQAVRTYRAITVTLDAPIKGELPLTFEIRVLSLEGEDSADVGGDDHEWSPTVGDQHVVFVTPGDELWTGGYLLTAPGDQGAPRLVGDDVQFPAGPVLGDTFSIPLAALDDLVSAAFVVSQMGCFDRPPSAAGAFRSERAPLIRALLYADGRDLLPRS
jgi:hypothetical protein